MRDQETKSRSNAKVLRGKMTNAEVILWSRLRRGQIHGVKFRRQHPIGPFIADFASMEMRLVIEVDGPSHVGERNMQRDQVRESYLRQADWEVFRVWNNEIYTNLRGVIEVIETRVWEIIQAKHHASEVLLPRPTGELTAKQAEGVLKPQPNTPSGLSGHLPRETGEEKMHDLTAFQTNMETMHP
jgi:very-short-patch-repair endonuclease